MRQLAVEPLTRAAFAPFGDVIEMEASISRRSDGGLMAYIVTSKQSCIGSAPTVGLRHRHAAP